MVRIGHLPSSLPRLATAPVMQPVGPVAGLAGRRREVLFEIQWGFAGRARRAAALLPERDLLFASDPPSHRVLRAPEASASGLDPVLVSTADECLANRHFVVTATNDGKTGDRTHRSLQALLWGRGKRVLQQRAGAFTLLRLYGLLALLTFQRERGQGWQRGKPGWSGASCPGKVTSWS